MVHYGLASTPAMFNSTVTSDEALLCPATGAILITGEGPALRKLFLCRCKAP